jgi:hypothetical protein
MFTRFRTILLAAVSLLPLAACGGGNNDLMRTIGLTRDVPDEFTVTTRAPLSMPPDFQLRPPSPGATRPQEQTPRQAAEATLSPQAALAPSAGMSPGQQALLAATGPAAPADIRAQVDRSAALESNSTRLTDQLMFWKPTPLPGDVVDPQKESQRIRSNSALGQPQDVGDTPIIQRAPSKGLLDRIF